jgi:superfamily II DNA or RNA helicase
VTALPDQAPAVGLGVAISPAGALVVEPGGEADDGLTAAARERLQVAVARGPGHGLLHLGLEHKDARLSPPLAFLRDLGKAVLGRLCADPDLEARRERVRVPVDGASVARLGGAVPPMPGAEYVTGELLSDWWGQVVAAFADEVRAFDGPVQTWLHTFGPDWNLVGRVCFHLAEHKSSPDRPFAFLATYATGAVKRGRPQHAPLASALAASSARGDRAQLLSLLVPVERAAQKSALVTDLLVTGDLYHPLAWTPAEAHEFLREIPVLEDAGVVVRVPDWWRARRPPRPEVTVTVGTKAPGAGVLGTDTLLDFDATVTLEGEALSAAEVRALLASRESLALVRGKWVELDRDRLREVLDHWQTVARTAEDGLSFLEGMRLLAGAPLEPGRASSPLVAEDTRVRAGAWLGELLGKLRGPDGLVDADPGPALRAELRPYQKTGVAWLWFATRLGLGVCLADDMGLGKTVQVLALLLLEQRARRKQDVSKHLLVVPASLLGNWQAEAARFAPSLRLCVLHASALPVRGPRPDLRQGPPGSYADADVVVTTYGTLQRLPWLTAQRFGLIVLDEAQAIKNAGSRQTRAVKALEGRARVALTGTPVENRLGDLWSLFDFLDPGLLGDARAFTTWVKQLGERPAEPYAPLRRLVAPYLLRRLKTDRAVIADLPDKIEVKAYCGLSRVQAALYQRSVDELAAELRATKEGMQRKGLVLAFLTRFKQICNHPAHWLKDGPWTEAHSGKLARLRELGEDIAARQEKVLVFTQFREAVEPLARFLEEVFARPGLVLHGGTQVKARQRLVERFQKDERERFLVLSLKAGGTGLNLTAASHVVHFDRWWNPAVEDQATDRAFRIGQHKNVLVHKLVCRGTVEERIDALIEAKQGLAREVVGSGAEVPLTELGDAELLELVSLDLGRAQAGEG